MLSLSIGNSDRALRRVLVVGAHADDIEIGCGGTILRLLAELPELEWWWVVLSAADERGREALTSACEFVQRADKRTVLLKEFRDGFFPYQGYQLKEFFEQLAASVSPDLIFTHVRHDLHQDHRLVSELTWNTFRDHVILEYEIPKYDGDLGSPNVFVPLSHATSTHKVEAIVRNFASQRTRRWFDEQVFFGLLRLRGVESNSSSGYAEAFYGRKLVI